MIRRLSRLAAHGLIVREGRTPPNRKPYCLSSSVLTRILRSWNFSAGVPQSARTDRSDRQRPSHPAPASCAAIQSQPPLSEAQSSEGRLVDIFLPTQAEGALIYLICSPCQACSSSEIMNWRAIFNEINRCIFGPSCTITHLLVDTLRSTSS